MGILLPILCLTISGFLINFSFALSIPGEKVDKQTLTSLGIKTIGWQGEEGNQNPNHSQVHVHHNYSKVTVQRQDFDSSYHHGQSFDQSHLQNIGQTTIDEGDYLEQNQENQQLKGFDQQVGQTNNFDSNSHNYEQNNYEGQYDYDGFDQNIFSQNYQGQKNDQLLSATSYDNEQIHNAHSYGQMLNLDQIVQAESSLQGQQKFEEYPDYKVDQTAEASNVEAEERYPKKFYTLDKPIYIHGFKYPPDPKDVYPLNIKKPTPPTETYTKCPKMVTGQFVYSLSCNQFLNCWKGRGFVQNCAPGTLFNPETLECDFASKVHCVTGPRKPEQSQPQNWSNQKLDLSCPAGFSGVIPHYSDCSKFINCANGVEHVMDCPPGTLFSLKINNCDFPYKTECASWSVKFGNVSTETSVNSNDFTTSGSYQGAYNNQDKKYASTDDFRDHQHNYNQGSLTSQSHLLEKVDQTSSQGYQNNYGHQVTASVDKNYLHGGHQQGLQGSHNLDQQGGQGRGYYDDHQQGYYGLHNFNQQNGQGQGYYEDHQQGFYGSHNLNQQSGQGQSYHEDHQQGFHGSNNFNHQVGQGQGYHVHQQTSQGQNQESSFETANQYIHGQNSYHSDHDSQSQDSGRFGGVGYVIKCPNAATGLFPHPFICSKFINCTKNKILVHDCTTGTVFNPATRACDFPYRVECYANNQDSSATNQWQASGDSHNIGKYNQQTSGTYQGQVSSNTASYSQGSSDSASTSSSGVLHSTYTETEAVIKCPPEASGLYPHPTICSKFLNCANGQTFIQDCGPGTVFNPNTKVCDFPHKVQCGSTHGEGLIDMRMPGKNPQGLSSSSSSSSPSGILHSTYSETHSVVRCPPQASGLYPHPTICSKFLNCANGQTFIQDCGPGTVFNPVSKVCDFPHKVDCGSTHGEGMIDMRGWSTNQTSGSQNNRYGKQDGSSQTQGGHVYVQASGNQEPYRPTSANQQGSSASISHNVHDAGNTYTVNKHGKNITQGGHYVYDHSETQGSYRPPSSSQHSQDGQSGSWVSVTHNIHDHGNSNTLDKQDGKNKTQGGHYVYVQTSGPQGSYIPIASDQHSQAGLYGSSSSATQNVYDHSNANTFNKQDGRNKTLGGHYVYIQTNGIQGSYKPTSLNQEGEGHYIQTEHNQGGPYSTAQGGPSSSPSYNQNQLLTSGNQDAQESKYFDKNIIYGQKYNKFHSTSPSFPKTDLNADYDFGNESATLEVGPEEPLKPQPPKAQRSDRKRKDFCEPSDFYCDFNYCIPDSMVCDGVKDCPNGVDEQKCERYVSEFTSISNSILAVRENERYLNVSVVFCSKSCLESKSFHCKSFSYRKDDGACLLSDTNVGLSGSLITSQPYNYYEVKAFTVNCTNLYICPNNKCISYKKVCDGINDCGDRTDEKACSAKAFGYGIKLSGTDKKHEGRIEIKAFGKAGYVCDDKFGLRDADVVCREVGFPLGALEVKSNSYYAKDLNDKDVLFLMDDVACLGNETTLRDCDFNGWGVSNCEPQEIVGVICKTPLEKCPNDHWKCDTTQECIPIGFVCDEVFDCGDESDENDKHCEQPIQVRLANGKSKYEGRVEIRYHGIWGTVCDDDFNDDSAKVVCKQLGYPGKATAKKDGHFGAGTGPIWLDQVFCQGNETGIHRCVHWNWGEHNCEHSEDVGVICSNTFEKLEDFGSERNVKIDTRFNEPLPEYLFPERCGLRKDDQFLDNDEVHFRVIKGSSAKRGDYPWQASLRIKSKTKPSHWCGAVVITQKFILTAAHCLDGFSKGSYIVIAGDYHTDDIEGTEQQAFIEEFYIHEKFREGQKMNNDIALIKLKGKGFTFTKDVQPICLPEIDLKYEKGLNCTISGFGSIESGKSGYSHHLRAGWIPLQSKEVCQMPHVYGTSITDGMVCAGSLDEGIDACDGDSGGPLACLHNGLFTLYGLTSWGQHCGHANKPGVYVKVSYYRNWIDETIKKHS